jgi:fused signal recognition particle receptor
LDESKFPVTVLRFFPKSLPAHKHFLTLLRLHCSLFNIPWEETINAFNTAMPKAWRAGVSKPEKLCPIHRGTIAISGSSASHPFHLKWVAETGGWLRWLTSESCVASPAHTLTRDPDALNSSLDDSTMKFFGGKKDTEIPAPADHPKAGFFDRMKQAVSRTRESLSSKIEGIVALTRTVDESTLENLESALLTSDIGVQTTTLILDALRDRARRQAIEGGDELRDLLKAQLRAILEAPRRPVLTPDTPPKVTFLVGVNGTGKTTSAGKLAAWYRNQARDQTRAEGHSVLLCAADTFRAAAIEQLEVWAARSGVDVIKTRQGGDPAAVLYDAIAAAKARNIEELIVDTAGRLHTKTGLMDELEKMRRTAARLIPGAPHDVLLVMDATTGQNGLQQARLFTQAAGVTGIVLTKLDGTAKGGIAVAIAQELNLPVRFVGVGEQMTDLLEFSPAAFVDSLLE